MSFLSSLSRRRLWPYLLLAATMLLWAGNAIVGRALREMVPPVALTFWRWSVALAILLPATSGELHAHRATVRAHWKLIFALACFGVVAFQTVQYHALTLTTALNSTLIMTLTPVAIALFARALFKERMPPLQAVGIALSFCGALLVIARGDLVRLAALSFNPGDLWMLASVGCWAAYSLLLKRRPPTLPLLTLLTCTVIAGLLLLLPLYLWRVLLGERMVVNATALLGVLYTGVFASVVAFTFWNRGVAAVGPTVAGVFINVMPVFGGALAVLFLGEQVAGYHLLGGLLVFAGIFLSARATL